MKKITYEFINEELDDRFSRILSKPTYPLPIDYYNDNIAQNLIQYEHKFMYESDLKNSKYKLCLICIKQHKSFFRYELCLKNSKGQYIQILQLERKNVKKSHWYNLIECWNNLETYFKDAIIPTDIGDLIINDYFLGDVVLYNHEIHVLKSFSIKIASLLFALFNVADYTPFTRINSTNLFNEIETELYIHRFRTNDIQKLNNNDILSIINRLKQYIKFD